MNFPARVLILSKDPTLLANRSGFGDTLQRHMYYAERLNHFAAGSEIRIVTFTTKKMAQQYLMPTPNIKIFGTGSVHRALFMADAFRILRHVSADGWVPTVITTQEPYEDGQLGLWLAKRCGARFIPQLHFDLFSNEWLKESYLNPLRRHIASRVLKKANAVRVVSQEQKRKLVSKLGLLSESIYVVPVGVSFTPTNRDREYCKANIHPSLSGHQVVLFVGRLYPPKNLKLWVDVAQHVLARAPETRFLVAGDGPLMESTKGYVQEKGLLSAFIFLGSVPYQKLPEIYGAADMFLLTSHYEGFGRVIVEANLASVPVVATACAGPQDIILNGKTGYLCNPADKESLANSVLALLRDDEKRNRFADDARIHIEEMFSRERLADSLVRMWAS